MDAGQQEEQKSRGTRNKELGRYGEECATHYLEKLGYDVIERNWTCPAGEVDIIARQGDAIVFVEVKTRSSLSRGFPEEAVTPEKRSRYERIAAYYLKEYDETELAVRFDVIGVLVLGPAKAMIKHHVSAFGVV